MNYAPVEHMADIGL